MSTTFVKQPSRQLVKILAREPEGGPFSRSALSSSSLSTIIVTLVVAGVENVSVLTSQNLKKNIFPPNKDRQVLLLPWGAK